MLLIFPLIFKKSEKNLENFKKFFNFGEIFEKLMRLTNVKQIKNAFEIDLTYVKGGFFLMKKLLLLILIVSMAISFVSCAGANDGEEPLSSTQETTETTETSNTTEYTETTETTYCTECSPTNSMTETTEWSETTVDHPHGGTGGTTGTGLETTGTEMMAEIDRYNLGMEYIMDYEALILTDGEEYSSYTSTIYCQNPYMVGDGILMFVSVENQLPHWIKEGVIPHVVLNEDSAVRFEYHEDAELVYTGRFRIYTQDENGVVTKIKEFENAELSDIYAYGKENLAGETVYISYPFMLQYGDYSYLTDVMSHGTWSNRAVHDIMCLFKTDF